MTITQEDIFEMFKPIGFSERELSDTCTLCLEIYTALQMRDIQQAMFELFENQQVEADKKHVQDAINLVKYYFKGNSVDQDEMRESMDILYTYAAKGGKEWMNAKR